ncbi:MAG: DNA gyrase subunit A [Rhodospirillales bacterium]|nr:MAG: DNA gyrase subunit A [Rhodospirillales bacterium]
MQRSYLDYAMSVIVSRALPDVRDGLKPVQRRIIFAMNESGYTHDRPYRKSARIVGDVMGKYHPHGDQAIYDTLVRMAQDFVMRLPLIDGQGNFGSMDGDRPAAMRYTEARLARVAHTLIEDIDKDTVEFQPNYDDSAREPTVLPARFPNLLVNGAGGIAVGMATNIPPHNLGEVIDACCALIDRPDLTIAELIENYIPGPDFPTGGSILGRQGIQLAYHTGRGSVVMRGRTRFEEVRKDRTAVIVDEVPYQVNKARMMEIIAEAVREKRIEGVSDLRDESDRDGVRVVVELKRDAEPEVVLNQLYRYTPLQTSFGINMLALDGGRPRTMNLKEVVQAFLDFREQVIRRRTVFELAKARERAHVLVGLAVAVANIDEVVALIRRSRDAAEARAGLTARAWPAADIAPLVALVEDADAGVRDGVYHLSDGQARAILDLRLHRLTGLERDKIGDDLRALGEQIRGFLEILSSRQRLLEVLREELVAIRERFATPRRTRLEDVAYEADVEDLIQREDMVVTVSNTGYIKRVPLSTYRAQRRGGRGRAGMATREEDFVSQVFVVNTHTPVLFFSSAGMVYKLKVYKLPAGTPQARGKALINLLPLAAGVTISTLMPLPEDEGTWGDLFVVFATASGKVRRNALSDFTNVMAGGKIAMKLDEGDRLVRVRPFSEGDDILLFSRNGQCIRFPVPEVRVFAGRTSTGVRGIRLAGGDTVINMCGLRHVNFDVAARDEYLQAVNARRRLAGSDYTDRTEDQERDSALAARLDEPAFQVMAAEEEFVLTVTDDGFGKRTSSYEYRISGRDGSGVAAIDLERPGGPAASVVAAFPVLDSDQIVMVTNAGQLMRCPVAGISVMSRRTRGVRLFATAEAERVVSVSRIRDVEDNGGGDAAEDAEVAAEAAEDPNAEAQDDSGKPAGPETSR